MSTWTITDLCELVKVSGQAGVSNLKVADIEISFNQMAGFEEIDLAELTPKVALGQDLAHNVNREDTVDHDHEVSEDDLSELAYTDPIAYENLQTGGIDA